MAGPCQEKCGMGEGEKSDSDGPKWPAPARKNVGWGRVRNETVTDLNGRPLPGKMWDGGG